MSDYPSRLIEQAVNEISRLPGIGKKSALRLVLHILKEDEGFAESLGNSIIRLRKEIKYCKQCHNISDEDICVICSGIKRDKSLLCVVEDIRDIMAIENTSQFNGLYHVLGGIISPIDGIGPDDINIDTLIKRVTKNTFREIIIALSTTIEGDTTVYYISKKLKDYNVPVSILARGVAIGDELEYIDEVTLGRSILNRTKYNLI